MLWLTILLALWVPNPSPNGQHDRTAKTSAPESNRSPEAYEKTPPIWMLERLRTDGRAGINEAIFDGRPTLIAAFATWCEPCAREVPMLNRLQRDYPGLRVVGLSVDDGPPGKVRSWIQRYRGSYPVYLPSTAVLAGKAPVGPVEDLPVLAFFSGDGTRTRRLVGMAPERLILKCLAELGLQPHHTPSDAPRGSEAPAD